MGLPLFLKILKNNKKDEITFGGFIFLSYICDRKMINRQMHHE